MEDNGKAADAEGGEESVQSLVTMVTRCLFNLLNISTSKDRKRGGERSKTNKNMLYGDRLNVTVGKRNNINIVVICM
jgi:hypothetical protein